jgi:Flp pilus assembly protein TadG
MLQLCARIIRDSAGSMAIETAVVAPVLVLMGLGTFEVSSIVSRQHELQTAASEGEIIALAAAQGATTDIDTIKEIITVSIDVGEDDVDVSRFYRCNASTTTVTAADSCNEDDIVSSYIAIEITDTYTPVWTSFGVGSPVNFSVERTVQLS